MDDIIKNIAEEFRQIKEIKAIVLSGSYSSNFKDELSDYDFYIYSDNPIDVQKRKEIAEKFSKKHEIDNRFFETGDEWVLENKKQIDIMYRNCNWIEEQITRVLDGHEASVGYSTCLVYNVKNSIILKDLDSWFFTLQEKTNMPYPGKLAQNIIKKNTLLMKEKISASFFEQIEKAIKREDSISVNHRISAFLASYFDVLFAKNKIFHPGEKRLLAFSIKNCKILPKNFESDMKKLFNCEEVNKIQILNNLFEELKNIL